jgi:hypothetical protein
MAIVCYQFESGTAINGVALAEMHPSTYPEQFLQTPRLLRL